MATWVEHERQIWRQNTEIFDGTGGKKAQTKKAAEGSLIRVGDTVAEMVEDDLRLVRNHRSRGKPQRGESEKKEKRTRVGKERSLTFFVNVNQGPQGERALPETGRKGTLELSRECIRQKKLEKKRHDRPDSWRSEPGQNSNRHWVTRRHAFVE